MEYAEQLRKQRAHAVWLLKEGVERGPLLLVKVEYPDMPARVSIIGSTISRAMPAIWRGQGATVTDLEEITADA